MAKKDSKAPAKGKRPDLQELGSTGLNRTGGFVHEEFLTNLRGLQGAKVYREMSDNDPTIGGMIFSVEKVIGGLDWRVDPFKDDSEDGKSTDADKEVAAFVESCLHDMENSWEQTLSGFLSFLAFGYSVHEIVYKIRGGAYDGDITRRSQFDDGKIGWRKLPVRAQETLFKWEFDPKTREILAMVQMDISDGGMHTIPMEKALHFRTTSHKDNPEGRSILRNVYRAWHFGRRLEEIEAIGVERDLAGLPIMLVPPELLSASATDDEKALLLKLQQMVTRVKRNEQEGLIIPAQYDDQGHLIYDFKLLSTGGSRNFDTDKIIARWDQRKTMALLSDFLLLGHDGGGNRSLGITKMELWTMAVDSIAKNISSVINQHAIPRLMKLNGLDTKRLPKLNHGQVSNIDLAEIGTFVSELAKAGLLIPDIKLENFLREIANLPPADHDGTNYGMPPLPDGQVTADTKADGAKPKTEEKVKIDATKKEPTKDNKA